MENGIMDKKNNLEIFPNLRICINCGKNYQLIIKIFNH